MKNTNITPSLAKILKSKSTKRHLDFILQQNMALELAVRHINELNEELEDARLDALEDQSIIEGNC